MISWRACDVWLLFFSRQGSTTHHCQYPCKCVRSNDAVGCNSGVSIIRDGCDCCQMCARQQGDLCDHRDKCDEEKGLYCDFVIDEGIRGLCRGTVVRSIFNSREIYLLPKQSRKVTVKSTEGCYCLLYRNVFTLKRNWNYCLVPFEH